MKIRNGFVSNSSSSSFLVFFPVEIKDNKQLYDLMWNEKNSESIEKHWNFKKTVQERIQKSYQKFINESYNSVNMSFNEFKDKATESVLNDIIEQGKNNYLHAISIISGEYWYDINNGILHVNDEQFKSLDDIKELIKEYSELEKELDNFDWNISNSDEEYNTMKDSLDNIYYIERIKSVMDDIDNCIEKHPNDIFYTFSYCDEGSTFFGIMEHGNIFGNLPVYVESHH